MNTYDEILKGLLEKLEQNPDASVDQLLCQAATEAGFSDEEIAYMAQGFHFMEVTNNNAKEIAENKNNGGTRKGWLSRKFDLLFKDIEDEKQKLILGEITNATVDIVEQNEIEK